MRIERSLFGSATAEEWIDTALGLPFGFAGFQAPACLTLAESIAVAGPHRAADVDVTLDAAREAAHNVQDPVFCARTTSRCNAMREDWWGPPGNPLTLFDPLEEAERLAVDPGAARYAPIHIVGEAYSERRETKERVKLPEWFRQATSLHALAERVYQQPVTEFLRLNREDGIDEFADIPHGTRVRVPDARFRAHLAARCAAEILYREDLPDGDRLGALQLLVPVAAAQTTALDTVLARLVLLASPQTPPEIERLAGIEARYVGFVVPPGTGRPDGGPF